MNNNKVATELLTKLPGTRNEYYLLKVYKPDESGKIDLTKFPDYVHSNKQLNEIKKIQNEYMKGIR